MNNTFDSKKDTIMHRYNVLSIMSVLTDIINKRAAIHDASKLEEPEKSVFDRVTPRLKEVEYGSDEYIDSLADMGEALKHHYESNRHHPEHFENGVDDMNLVDLVEMFCDWVAASQRQKNGDILYSIHVKQNAGVISSQLASIFRNTVKMLGEEEFTTSITYTRH